MKLKFYQYLLIIYCIINAVIVTKLTNDTNNTQEQLDITSELLVTYVKLRTAEKKFEEYRPYLKDDLKIVPMQPLYQIEQEEAD